MCPRTVPLFTAQRFTGATGLFAMTPVAGTFVARGGSHSVASPFGAIASGATPT